MRKRKGCERQIPYLNHTTSATEEEEANDYHGVAEEGNDYANTDPDLSLGHLKKWSKYSRD